MSRVETITPYGTNGDERTKSAQVRDMFDNIAPAYDGMNRLMTLGIDRKWRKKCTKIAAASKPDDILDVAAGTGDLTLALAHAIPQARVTGVDLSENMLEIGRQKINKTNLQSRVELKVADALALPFDDNSFDVITIAFGVRNFEHLAAGLAEMLRVLRPGGSLIILELCLPSSAIIKPFYNLYTQYLIPVAGRLMSKDVRAYKYLPESIAAVPARKEMCSILDNIGFRQPSWKGLSFGVAAIYTATK